MVLDPATLDRLRQLNEEGEPDLVVEVLTLFLDDAPARVDAVANAFEAGSAADLRRAAHGLKGAAGNIGAQRLQAACARVEEHAGLDQVNQAGEDVASLRAEFDALTHEIRRVLST